MTTDRVPVATYRIQLSKDFRFLDARDIVPYLHELGVSDLYLPPRYRPRRGSSHGYDVVDPTRINSELGTDEEFDDLCERLKHYAMGLLEDIVPNHMAASGDNPWWTNVLENGPSSPYAHYFDIDWHPATAKAAFLQDNRVLLPVLGDLYGNVLESQGFALRLDEGGFYVRSGEGKFPLDPKTYGPILDHCAKKLAESLGEENSSVKEMHKLQEAVVRMPARTVTESDQIRERLQSAAAIKQKLFHMHRDEPEVRAGIDAALRDLSGEKEKPRSFDLLHQILEAQAYRLASWRIAFEEINYRRFFDINDLVSLRVEQEDVFKARHQAILQRVHEGKVSGLRVDHIDGLLDPLGYLARLQSAVQQNLYVVVEKILGRDELLPDDWQTSGTTGYDFLNALNDVLIEPRGLEAIEAAYGRLTGATEPFAEVCYARSKQVMRRLFAGEVNAFGHRLGKLAAQDRQARDIPLSDLMNAFVEVTACLPVYRTYIRSFEISARDRSCLEHILELARRRTRPPQEGKPAFDFLRRVLLLDPPPYAAGEKQEWLSFVMRWQQFTAPVMAKGLEDTASYVHNSLISRNEVGGDPLREKPPLCLEEFHQFNRQRLKRLPHSLNATSTHDSKRSEDVRARIDVLSEIPEEWERRLRRWVRWNAPKKTAVDRLLVPTPDEEVLLYQTLLGAWPLGRDEAEDFGERIRCFTIKAVREAKTHSDWMNPNEPYEAALLRFIDAVFQEPETSPFRRDFTRFQERVAFHGALNSLSQVLIKITAPGVPDFYQGTELWNLRLVDPDNRRPVCFRKRTGMLEELRKRETGDLPQLLRDILREWKDGRVKLYLTDKALEFRRAHAQMFLDGDYIPLVAAGRRQANVCAFGRKKNGSMSLTIAPRWTTQLASPGKLPLGKAAWHDTSVFLPKTAPDRWRNVLTGERLKVSLAEDGEKLLYLRNIFRKFPVALLVAE